MPRAMPVIDLDAAEAGDSSELGAVRAATEDLGAVQVVNHGVPQDLIADLSARTARLLGLPRAEKAKLASPHPYRGWRQWPDDFGRLELERFNVAQFDDIGHARAAGLDDAYLGLYAHANVWPHGDPPLDRGLRLPGPGDGGRAAGPVRGRLRAELVGAVRVWDHVKDRVADYLAEYGRPEQVAAWRDGQPYVADLAENSAGR